MSMRVNDYKTYRAIFNTKTGEFIRKAKEGFEDPQFCAQGPELADIHITDYCPMNCSYCYRESNPHKSNHMDPQDFKKILQDMSPHVFQVAIGGGSPQHHPEFTEILRIAHEMNIIPSYTSNGLDMTKDILDATKQYAGAVALSMHNLDRGKRDIEYLLDNKIEPAIHVVLDKKSIDYWAYELDKAESGEGMFGGKYPLYSCICLMHKPIGRGDWEQHPEKEQKANFVESLKQYRGGVAIGIDSCFSSSLISMSRKSDLPRHTLGPCDSGCFSVFVGEDLMVSPCSFNLKDQFSLNDYSFEEIWKEKFKPYRDKVLNQCPGCEMNDLCHSCYAVPDINPCGRKERTL